MDTSLWSDDVWVVDSTPVECGGGDLLGGPGVGVGEGKQVVIAQVIERGQHGGQ